MFSIFRLLAVQELCCRILAGLLSMGISVSATSAELSDSTQRFAAPEMNPGVAGRPSQVMVLGSAHLFQNDELRSLVASKQNLQPLLDRLATFKPDLIAIEALSGRDCDMLMHYAKGIPKAYENYCRKTAAAKGATGLSVADAESSLISILRTWPATPTPSDRRHLAAIFLAANDPYSALVQWLRLPQVERRIGNGLDEKLVGLLTSLQSEPNENDLIGSSLAARLTLDRVYPIDDHSADSIIASLGPAYDKAMQKIWSAPNPFLDDYKARAKVKSGADLLALFRYVNDPATNRQAVLTDMGRAVQAGPPLYGRMYNGWWETRNLRMVSNIRAVLAEHPGGRLLVIVGATHKAYFENYLDLMAEVEVADTSVVLK